MLSPADVPDAVRLPAGVGPGDGSAEDGGGTPASRQTLPAGGQHPADGPLRRRDGGGDEAAALRHDGPADRRSLDCTAHPRRRAASSQARAPAVRPAPPRGDTRSAAAVRLRTVQVAQEDAHVQVENGCDMPDIKITRTKLKIKLNYSNFCIFTPSPFASINTG